MAGGQGAKGTLGGPLRMAAVDCVIPSILPVLAGVTRKALFLYSTDFGHGLTVLGHDLLGDCDTNRSFKYAWVVWLEFLLLPSALRKLQPR